ncbi:hypothetical protein [Candidatus Karelsulcia muelleri]|uniref:hypothetical protein n=1 Tax=Candidatus Karelsulcia muelleri TaxID=336810 RepID=UPI000D7BA4F2|nr:hypothetical protein [Candidatus Karelsulcia muelleri]
MNIKEYKNCKDSTKTVDYKDFDKTGNNVYSLISLLSKRSETIFCYIKSKLKKKIKLCPPEPKHLEEVVLYEAKMKISKIFEKISKPTSLAIREFLDKKLYYIFKKQLKKTIKQIIKNQLRNKFNNQDPFFPLGNQLEKEKEEEEEEKEEEENKLVNKKNFNNNKKFKIKLENKLMENKLMENKLMENKLKKKLEKKLKIQLEKNFKTKLEAI